MRLFILSLLWLLCLNHLSASPIDSSLLTLINDLSEQYTTESGTLYTKRNLALGEIKNLSKDATSHFIGEGVRALLKPLLGTSLIFQLVERENLEEVVKEIELSLSGMTDSATAVKVGNLENVHVILTGSVTEEGDHFVITLELIDVETGKIRAVSKNRVEKSLLIKESNRVSYQYVMANGIGISLQVTPLHFLMFPLDGWADMENNLGGTDVSLLLTYRLNRNLKFLLNIGGKMHTVHYDNRSYSSLLNMDPATLTAITTGAVVSHLYKDDGSVNSSNPETEISDMSVSYHLNQEIFHFGFMIGGVLPMTREFNLSLGLGPAADIISYNQAYDQMLVEFRDGARFTRREYGMTYFTIGSEVQAQLEYFILPRLSLNLSGSYHHHFIIFPFDDDDGAYCLSTGEYFYQRNNRDLAAFGLNPFLMPDGTELNANTYSGNFFHILVGFSVYF